MKKAPRVLVFLAVLTLTLSMSLSAFAAPNKGGNGNGNGHAQGHEKHQPQATVQADVIPAAATDTVTPEPWSVTKHRNLVKFESSGEKGGKILIPIQAIEHQLGVTVGWDPENQVVTITSGQAGLTLVIKADGITSTLVQAAAATLNDQVIDPLVDDGNHQVAGNITGTISGDVSGPFTGTYTGTITSLPEVVDPALQTVTGTFTGTITDPVKGLVTFTGKLEGTVAAPTLTLDADITDTDSVGLGDLTSGHACVPFQYLADTLGPAITTDTSTGTVEIGSPITSE